MMRVTGPFILGAIALCMISGFDKCGSSVHQPPPAGFELHTWELLEDPIFGAIKNEVGGIGVQGNCKADQIGQAVVGNTKNFSGYSSNLTRGEGDTTLFQTGEFQLIGIFLKRQDLVMVSNWFTTDF